MEIKIQLTEKDFEKFVVQIIKSENALFINVFRIAVPIVPVLITMALVYYKYGGIKFNIPVILEGVLYGVVVAVLFEQAYYWFLRRKGRQFARADSDPNVVKKFDEFKVVVIKYNKLRVDTEEGVLKITEPFYKGMIDARDYLIYGAGEENVLVVPKRVFQSEEEQAKFKEMICKFIVEES